jgi:hypothetical protein
MWSIPDVGNVVALLLRDKKAELSNKIDEAFGIPVAERQDYSAVRSNVSNWRAF